MADKQKTQRSDNQSSDSRSRGNNSQRGNSGNSHQEVDLGTTSGDQRREGGAQQASERRDSRNGNTGGSQRSGR